MRTVTAAILIERRFPDEPDRVEYDEDEIQVEGWPYVTDEEVLEQARRFVAENYEPGCRVAQVRVE